MIIFSKIKGNIMKYQEILNKVLEINQKFEKCDKDNTSELYFEMLHSCLFEILSGYTEEQYNNLTKPFRETIKKLEEKLLDCCSMTYYENFKEYVEVNGRFYKANKESKEENNEYRIITKCKQQIGFIKDEELNI